MMDQMTLLLHVELGCDLRVSNYLAKDAPWMIIHLFECTRPRVSAAILDGLAITWSYPITCSSLSIIFPQF